jgi:hypothetical protein
VYGKVRKIYGGFQSVNGSTANHFKLQKLELLRRGEL